MSVGNVKLGYYTRKGHFDAEQYPKVYFALKH